MFNGLYRAPNKAWQTTLWFATGQKLATQEEAFDMDWGGYMRWHEQPREVCGKLFEIDPFGTVTGRIETCPRREVHDES